MGFSNELSSRLAGCLEGIRLGSARSCPTLGELLQGCRRERQANDYRASKRSRESTSDLISPRDDRGPRWPLRMEEVHPCIRLQWHSGRSGHQAIAASRRLRSHTIATETDRKPDLYCRDTTAEREPWFHLVARATTACCVPSTHRRTRGMAFRCDLNVDDRQLPYRRDRALAAGSLVLISCVRPLWHVHDSLSDRARMESRHA